MYKTVGKNCQKKPVTPPPSPPATKEKFRFAQKCYKCIPLLRSFLVLVLELLDLVM